MICWKRRLSRYPTWVHYCSVKSTVRLYVVLLKLDDLSYIDDMKSKISQQNLKICFIKFRWYIEHCFMILFHQSQDVFQFQSSILFLWYFKISWWTLKQDVRSQTSRLCWGRWATRGPRVAGGSGGNSLVAGGLMMKTRGKPSENLVFSWAIIWICRIYLGGLVGTLDVLGII